MLVNLIEYVSGLTFLTVKNESNPEDEGGLSGEELDKFVSRITVIAKLKYAFTLIQFKNFPND